MLIVQRVLKLQIGISNAPKEPNALHAEGLISQPTNHRFRRLVTGFQSSKPALLSIFHDVHLDSY